MKHNHNFPRRRKQVQLGAGAEEGSAERGYGPLPYYHRLRHTGYLRHLLVRKAAFTGEVLIDLVTTTQRQPDLSGFANSLLELQEKGLLKGSIAGILHTKNDSPADVVVDQGTEVLYGKDFFTEELLGLRFKVTPFSFFQTNSHGAEVLYNTARSYLSAGSEAGRDRGIVYDLYSGTGTIAQLMAPAASRVIGVEIVEEAVEAARINAVENGLTNCEFIAGDVLKVLDTIEQKPDTIILDPPRDGIHPKALPKILSYGVDNILYISCLYRGRIPSCQRRLCRSVSLDQQCRNRVFIERDKTDLNKEKQGRGGRAAPADQPASAARRKIN